MILIFYVQYARTHKLMIMATPYEPATSEKTFSTHIFLTLSPLINLQLIRGIMRLLPKVHSRNSR